MTSSLYEHDVVSSGTTALQRLVIPKEIKAGPYTVRFAASETEIHAAQALRYRVFYEEKNGCPTAAMRSAARDMDEWDDGGFHVIVIDDSLNKASNVLGALRLFDSECLAVDQHFYTEETFDLSRIKTHFGRALELSRFCIDSSGRGGVILMLIWKYTMSFIQDNNIPVLLGCASFSGVNVDEHLPVMNYLYEHYLSDAALMPQPKTSDYINLTELYQPGQQWAEAQKSIPTLLRGYLKLGAKISDAAIIDLAFNTVYVAIYAETQSILKSNSNLVTHV